MCRFYVMPLALACLCSLHCMQCGINNPASPIHDGNNRDAGNTTSEHVHIHFNKSISSTDEDIGTAESDYFVGSLFQKYSGSELTLTLDGFTRLMCNLHILPVLEADDTIPTGDETRVQSVRGCENLTFANVQSLFDAHKSHKESEHLREDEDGHENGHADDHSDHDHQPNQNAEGGNGLGAHHQGSETSKRRRGLTQRTTHDHRSHTGCVGPKDLLEYFHIPADSNELLVSGFRQLCPALIYQIDQSTCHVHHHDIHEHHDDHDYHDNHDHHHGHDHDHHDQEEVAEVEYSFSNIPGRVWGFSIVAVFIISLVGLFGVAVIPIMQKVFYNHLLQLLVALAVGALSGDALLHLLPHAISKNLAHNHDHSSEGSSEADHLEPVWKGLVALLCIFFFFLTERILTIVTEKKRRKKTMNRLKKKRCERLCDIEKSGAVGAKLSAHEEGDYLNCDQMVMVVHGNRALKGYADATHDVMLHQCDETLSQMEETLDTDIDPALTGIGHSHHAHGHGHSHAHCDTIPGSVAAVAWMVILGDGIHNFSDGLAIGAAFASSVTGGISTSIAVFCHELPHEIGDFAVLLRAGMTVKQAIVYNCVSSVLCFFGMLIGVAIGNIHSASLWIFAGVGGMFLYISMVDMLPEMTVVDTKKGENQFLHLFLQVCGMILGASIMLVIAVYEHDLQSLLG